MPYLTPYPLPLAMGGIGLERVFRGGRTNLRVDYKNERKSWILKNCEFATHVVMKGNTEDVMKEVGNFSIGRVEFPGLRAIVDQEVNDLCTGMPYVLNWEEIVKSLNMKASPGEPYRKVFNTNKALFDALGENTIRESFEEMERKLVSGELDSSNFETTFLVHSKRDKYALKKLKTAKFRSIQGGDLFLLYIMTKFFTWVSKTMNAHEGVMTSYLLNEFCEKFFASVGTDCFVGVDFSAFDRTQAENLIRMILQSIGEKCEIPEKLLKWVVDQVASAPLTMPNGYVFERFGGNPSGQFLTTVVNTVYHRVVMACFCVQQRCDFPRMNNTGDDGVYGGTEERMKHCVENFPKFCAEFFGITVKWERNLAGGEIFHFPEIPAYVGRTIISDGTFWWTVLSDVPRILAHWYNCPRGDTFNTYSERATGIDVALSGWRLAQGRGLTVPKTVLDFWKCLEEEGVGCVDVDQAFMLNVGFWRRH